VLQTSTANLKPEASPARRRSRDCKLLSPCTWRSNALPSLLQIDACAHPFPALTPTTYTYLPEVVCILRTETNLFSLCYRDDGTLEGGRANGLGAGHRLGPKANQGAINAGLRALDRSGKPCRKWAKGGFTLKSFTGTVWEVPRWTAPPKPTPEPVTEESASVSAAVSAAGSSKENKENGQVKSDSSNHDADVEMQSVHSAAAENSPAAMAIAVV